MRIQVTKAVLVAALLALVPASVHAQKPRWSPVTFEYKVPAGMNPGDETETLITMTATARLPRLEVQVHPLEGLEVLEGEGDFVFDEVAKGETRQVRVRVRLSAEKGQLSIFARTKYERQSAGATEVIEYGARKDAAFR